MEKTVKVLAIAAIIALTACSDDSSSKSTKSDQHQQPLLTGYVGLVTQKGSGYPCFDSIDTLNSAVSALAAHDKYGFAQAAAGHSVTLVATDRVRGIGSGGPLGSATKLRIESGANEGVACWVPSDTPGLFKNVHDDAGA